MTVAFTFNIGDYNMMPKNNIDVSTVLEQNRNKATAYTKLAYAVNATNNALRRRGVDSQKFRKQYPEVKRIFDARRTTSSAETDVWTVFNVLLQKRLHNPLAFDSNNTASVAVDVNGRIFHVTIKKVDDKENEYDVQLARYYEAKEGKSTVLKLGEPFTDVLRIKKKKNLLIASDPKTGVSIVRNQYVDRNYQAEAMLATVGMQLEDKGKISPITVNEEQVPVNNAQLVLAGTGAGKGGIIATTAMMRGKGVFVTIPGKLVDDMVREANSFIKSEDGRQLVEKFPDDIAPEDVAAYLHDHPYTVMSHDQLIFYADVLKKQNIFLDEAHIVVPKVTKGDNEAQARSDKLKEIVANNQVLGVTATPTMQLKELLGDPIYDLSLYKAQNNFKTVRAVSSNDVVVNEEKLAENAVKKLLTRSATVQPSMRGWVRDKTKNTVLSSQVQGFVFTDDPNTALEVHNMLSGLKANSNLRAALNKDALQDRFGKKKTREKVDIYDEVTKTQRKIIECNVKIDIIVALGVIKNTKRLQELVRNKKFDELDKIYTNALERKKGTGKVKEILKEFSNKMESAKNETPVLKEYYNSVQEYFDISMKQPSGNIRTNRLLEVSVNKLHAKSRVSELLVEQNNPQAEKNAATLQKKGLRMYVVSTGPLGTGHDDPNIRSTVVVEKHAITKNLDINGSPVIKRVQQCGRLIRANDGIAFGSSVTDEAIPEEERNLTFKEVYSADATERYLHKLKVVDDYLLQNQEVKPLIKTEDLIGDSDPEQIDEETDEEQLWKDLEDVETLFSEDNLEFEDDNSNLEQEDEEQLWKDLEDFEKSLKDNSEFMDDNPEEENLEQEIVTEDTKKTKQELPTIEEVASDLEEDEVDAIYNQQIIASRIAVMNVEEDVEKVTNSVQEFKEAVLKNNEMSVKTLSYIGDVSIKMFDSNETRLKEVLTEHKNSLEVTKKHLQNAKIFNSEFDSNLNQALQKIDSALEQVQELGTASKNIETQIRQEIAQETENMNNNTISLLTNTIENLEQMQHNVETYLQANQGLFSQLWGKLFGESKYNQIQSSQQKISDLLTEAKNHLSNKEQRQGATYTSTDKERYDAEQLATKLKDLQDDIKQKGVELEEDKRGPKI